MRSPQLFLSVLFDLRAFGLESNRETGHQPAICRLITAPTSGGGRFLFRLLNTVNRNRP